MSYVKVTPDTVGASASQLADIGATLRESECAAAGFTISVAAPAQDQLSSEAASAFSSYARQYEDLSAQMAAFHRDFVAALGRTAKIYEDAEAANTVSLRAIRDLLA